MAETELNKIVVLEPCSEAVNDLLASVEEKGQAELIRVKSAEEAQQLALHHQPCMLVATIQENGDVPSRVNMLKKIEKTIKSGMIKTMVVSKLKNKQLSAAIAAMGVTDYMEEPVPTRTMQFKANLQLKSVATIRKQQELKKKSEEKIVFKKSDQKQEGDATPQGQSAKKAPPLAIKEDYFLFKNSGVKKAGKKVVVEMEGPDPSTGEWTPETKEGDESKVSWKWKPKEEDGEPPPAADEGWVHEGDKPTFNEESGKWQFVSEKPELSYKKAGETLAKKISTDETGEVVVAEDSPAAEENVKKSRQKAEKARSEDSRRVVAEKEEAGKEKPESERQKPEFKALRQEKERVKGLNRKDIPRLDDSGMELLNKLGSGEEEEHAPLNDKTAAGGEDDPVFNNHTGQSQEEKKGPEKTKGMSPLDFLQKKKELLQKAVDERPEEETSTEEKIESELETEEAKKREPAAPERPQKKEKERKPPVNAALAALERLKKRAEEKLPEVEEEGAEEEEQEAAPVEEEPEEISGEEAPARKAKKRSAASRKLPEQLAEKKIRERPPALAKEEKKRLKKEALKNIQELLAEPLSEEISPEEEEELREALGLKGRPEIPPKELARKKRLNDLKELKEKVKELDDIPEVEEEGQPEFNEHDLSPDELDNTWSQQVVAGEKRKAMLKAHTDGFEKPDEEEDGEKRLKALEKEKKKRKPAFGSEEEGEVEGKSAESSLDEGDPESEEAVEAGENIGDEGSLSGRSPSRRTKRSGKDAASLLAELEKEEEEIQAEEDPSSGDREESIPEAEEDLLESPVRERESPASTRDASSLLKSLEEEAEALQSTLEGEEGTANSTETEVPGDKEQENIGSSGSAAADPAFELKKKKERPPIPAPGENLSEFLKKDSPAMEKFLERRKSKVRTPPTGPSGADPSNPFLGVMVSISNAFGPLRDRNRAVAKILRAMEDAFTNCFVYVLAEIDSHGIGTVQIASGRAQAGGEQMDTGAGLAFPVQQSENDSSEVRGILYLQPSGDRESFSAEEESAARRASVSLWAVLSQTSEKEERAA